jgi:hypothetical protein
MLRVNVQKKRRGQEGFVVTAELLLISTILVLGLITGFTKLRDQTLAELSDSGNAIGAIDQSYTLDGTNWTVDVAQVAEVAGFAYEDAPDNGSDGDVGGDGDLILYLPAPAPSTAAGFLDGEAGTN